MNKKPTQSAKDKFSFSPFIDFPVSFPWFAFKALKGCFSEKKKTFTLKRQIKILHSIIKSSVSKQFQTSSKKNNHYYNGKLKHISAVLSIRRVK